MKRKLESNKLENSSKKKPTIADAEMEYDDDEEEDGQVPQNSGFKYSEDELYKPPTTEELNMLRETENLFHSSLFRLQIDELLQETKLKKYASMEKWLQELTDLIESLPNDQQTWNLNDDKLAESKGIKMPLAQVEDCQGSYRFMKPSNITTVGSFPLKTASRRHCVVDIVVEMPAKCIQRKTDFFHHRYHRKRVMYLISIAALIRDNPIVGRLKFSFLKGDAAKPVLLVTPSGDLGKRYSVNIIPQIPIEVVKLLKFKPSVNNIKESATFPTPRYNSSIVADATITSNFAFLSNFLKENDTIIDGLRLLNIWLHQRELDTGFGCFSLFIMSMYVAFLLKARKLNVMMSSYQLFRNTLLHLEKSDWTTCGISLAVPRKGQPSLQEFHQEFEVVFVDPSGFCNLCANMSSYTFKRVLHECRLSLDTLDTPGIDSFSTLLMLPAPFINKFDHLIHLKCNDDWMDKNVKKWDLDSKVADLTGRKCLAVLPKVVEYLQLGLGKRISIIDVKLPDLKEWSLDEIVPNHGSFDVITFGLVLNQEFANSVLDKGPSADKPEAKEFQTFWGQKSELRRFQDGSICEAVLWPGKMVSEHRLVCKQVVEFVLERHLMIPPDNIKYIGSQIDSLLSVPIDGFGTGEEPNLKIHQVYDAFTKELRQLRNLPLNIHSIVGVSPTFSYTEVFPSIPYQGIGVEELKYDSDHYLLPKKPKFCPEFVRPLNVLLEMEASGKWPHDYDALQRVKAAFYIDLAKKLWSQCYLPSRASADALTVMKEGYAFKIQIASKREVACLKRVKAPDGKILTKESDETRQLETFFFILPKIRSALHGLQMYNTNFSAACRLCKRWVSAQLLADHFPDICVELIVAYVFLYPAPFTVPNSPQVAFLRFLRLLASFDWKTNALIVNFNNELKKDDVTEIQTKFLASRQELPVVFIATPYDKYKSVWTLKSPTAQILHRIIVLADKAFATLQLQLSAFDESDYKTIFRPPMDIYDITIHLKPSILPNAHEYVDYKSQKVNSMSVDFGISSEYLPVIGFNPVECYLQELKDAHGEVAMFFYDKYGGDFIAVLWKPHAFEPMPFKVQNINCRVVCTEDPKDVKTIPNVEAVLEDFSVLGAGLVKSVETKTDRWTIF